MTGVWLPLGIVIGCAVAPAIPRVRLRWLRRHHERRDFCEACGAQPRRISVLTTSFADDDALGMEGGRSFMAATYCRRHAPAGARRKPNPRR